MMSSKISYASDVNEKLDTKPVCGYHSFQISSQEMLENVY